MTNTERDDRQPLLVDRATAGTVPGGGFGVRVTLIAAIAAAAVTATVVVAVRANASSVPRCPVSALRIDKAGEQGFTSHVELILALRNVAHSTCQLSGYPRIKLLDGSARAMPTRVRHHGGARDTVVLKPWHRAFFTFTYTTNGPCAKSVFAYGARVTPHGSRGGVVWYAGKFGLCGPRPASVTVSPLSPKRQF
jgi:Domain of unknown function (DUF4232)